MTTTVTIDFTVGDTVYHVDSMKGIRKGIVNNVKVAVKPSGTVISYDVTFIQSKYGSVTADSSTLYVDYATAATAYETIVEST